MLGRLGTVTELAFVLVLVGCSASEPEPAPPSGPVSSNHGLYLAEFSFQPDPPSVGENHLTLRLEAAEAPVVGAKLTFQFYMPAHGHEVADAPSVTEIGSGNYETGAIVYNMPGTWQLSLDVAAASGNDTFVLLYDVH
jgi:hypothetical protein